jgi:hypothetical protein
MSDLSPVSIRLPRGEWLFDPSKPSRPAGGLGRFSADALAGRFFQHVLAFLDSAGGPLKPGLGLSGDYDRAHG